MDTPTNEIKVIQRIQIVLRLLANDVYFKLQIELKKLVCEISVFLFPQCIKTYLQLFVNSNISPRLYLESPLKERGREGKKRGTEGGESGGIGLSRF